MQTKERYSDRRCNKRRHDRIPDPAFEISLPDQNRRHGDRRCNPRRRNERLNLSFEISLSDQNVQTVNVSSSGVYFEVSIKDMDDFVPGTIIPLQINSVVNTTEYRERKLKFSGRGTVIRNCIIENLDLYSSLGVALEFTETLNIV
jgi:hypothetical protein